MSLKKPDRWISCSLFLICFISLLIVWLQSTPSITIENGEQQTSQSLSHTSEAFHPFQIEIKEDEVSLNHDHVKNLQVVLTAQEEVSNLYLKVAFIQDMDIIVSDQTPPLPQQIPLLRPENSPLIHNIQIRFTGNRPFMILHAYVLGPNEEKIGELAEFYRETDQNFLNIPVQRRLQIDPKKTRVIR